MRYKADIGIVDRICPGCGCACEWDDNFTAAVASEVRNNKWGGQAYAVLRNTSKGQTFDATTLIHVLELMDLGHALCEQ